MLKPKVKRTPVWTSSFVALLAVSGGMLGLAQPDALTYAMFQQGGSAFLLMYVGCLLLIGVPTSMAWLFLGRSTTSLIPADSVKKTIHTNKLSRFWAWLGHYWWLLAFLLLVVVVARLAVFTAELTAAPMVTLSLLPLAGVLLLVWLMGAASPVWQGRMNACLMAALLLFCGYLLWGSYQQHTLVSSWHEVFSFHYERLSWLGLLEAVKLALLTSSLGGAALWVYGRYLPEKPASLLAWSLHLVLLETLAALWVGFAEFALQSGLPLEPGSGHYQYLLVAPLASLLAASALSEGVAVRLTAAGLKRPLALLLVLLAAAAGAWLVVQQSVPLGALAIDWLLPLALISLAVLVGWMLKETRVRKALQLRVFALYLVTRALLRLLVPLAALALLGQALGLW